MPLRDTASYRIVVSVLKLTLVPVALVWLLGSLSGIEWSHVAITAPAVLMAALIVNQIALAVFALRMQLALRLCRIEIGWLTAQRIHLESMFYFFVLPMTVGLELARFLKIREQRPEVPKTNLAVALVLDRLLGAGSALALATACLFLVDIQVGWQASAAEWALAFVFLVLLASAPLLWTRLRQWLAEMYQLTQGRRLAFSLLFLLSVGMHMIFAWGIKLAAVSLGLQVHLTDVAFAIAGGMLLVAIPISFAGIGPAEAGVAALFLALGYQPTVAVTMGILPYLARLIGAFQGGAWEAAESGMNAVGEMQRLMSARGEPNASAGK